MERFLDLWTELGASAWYRYWLDEVQALRQEFARLINASIEEVAILPNISSALAAVSFSLDYSQRKRVVCCELDFPTLPHHFLAKGRDGVETVILPSPDKIGDSTGSLRGSCRRAHRPAGNLPRLFHQRIHPGCESPG